MLRILSVTAFLFLTWAALPARAANITVCALGCNEVTINDAIDAAMCGDNIILAASETFYGGDGDTMTNNPVVLLYKNCMPGNPITITTSESSKLPPSGVRITPDYADGAGGRVVPLVMQVGNGMVLKAQVGDQACTGMGPCPAHDYVIRGIEFCCKSNYSDFIGLGATGAGSDDPLINTLDDLPHDIELDQVIIRSNPVENIRRCITYDTVGVTVKNSWIDCGYDLNASDSQGVGGYSGQQITLENNYIAGTTEVVSFSGACSPIRTPTKSPCSTATAGVVPTDAVVTQNEITKPAWVYKLLWTANTAYPKGQIIYGTGGPTPIMRALNQGTSGGSEPTWPGSVNGTVVDGTITWERTDTTPQAKNLLEAKAVDGLTITSNYMAKAWPQGQQGYAITLTTSTAGPGAFATISDVEISGNMVTQSGSGVNSSATDRANDINAIASILAANSEPYVFVSTGSLVINTNSSSKSVSITAGTYTAQELADHIGPQISPALACDVGGALVIRARKTGDGSSCSGLSLGSSGDGTALSITTGNTVIGLTAGWSVTSCFNPRSRVWYGCGAFNGFNIHDNVWAQLNLAPYESGVPYIFSFYQLIHDLNLEHNTVDAYQNMGVNIRAVYTEGYDWMPFGVSVPNNIFGFRTNMTYPITYGGSVQDFSAINYWACNVEVTNLVAPDPDAECPAGVVTHNIFPGVTLYGATTRNTSPFYDNLGANSYPSDNWNDTWSSSWFVDVSTLDYTLAAPASMWINAGTDGKDIGADMDLVPLIKNLAVNPGATTAAFSWDVSSVTATQDCMMQMSTNQWFSDTIADLDPFTFSNPAYSAAGASHSKTIGTHAALTPSTLYYYHLMCGGATAYGNVTTAAGVPQAGRARGQMTPRGKISIQ